MSRRWATVFLAVVLLFSVLAAVWIWRSRSGPQLEVPTPEPSITAAVPLEPDPEETRDIVLYFLSLQDELVPEIRTVEQTSDPRRQVQKVIEALLAGPENQEIRAPLNADVRLGGVYLGTSGVVYLDFRSDHPDPPPTGSTLERLTVASLVESVLANVPELGGVVLLWNGEQPETFGGHLDTSRPLRGGEVRIATSP